MALNEKAVKNAKPTDKAFKLDDRGGLNLAETVRFHLHLLSIGQYQARPLTPKRGVNQKFASLGILNLNRP